MLHNKSVRPLQISDKMLVFDWILSKFGYCFDSFSIVIIIVIMNVEYSEISHRIGGHLNVLSRKSNKYKVSFPVSVWFIYFAIRLVCVGFVLFLHPLIRIARVAAALEWTSHWNRIGTLFI